MSEPTRPETVPYADQCKALTHIDYEGMNDEECQRPKGHEGVHYAEAYSEYVWWQPKEKK